MTESISHYLYPSSLYVSGSKKIIYTILGSCVSICLFDPYLQVGGMNHFMLPLWNGKGLASPKYGNIANEKLLMKMQSFGCKTSHLQAKVFGGAEVINSKNFKFDIGTRNVYMAFEYLEKYKIPIIAKSIGGFKGRKIQFDSSTSTVHMKYIERLNINNLVFTTINGNNI